MAYRDQAGTASRLPARVEIELAKLPHVALERVRARLSERVVLADHYRLAGELTAWGMLAICALGTSIGIAVGGLGIVAGSDAHSIVAALIHAVAAALFVRSVIGIAVAMTSRGVLSPGRILLPTGLLEIHGARMHVLPADRIARIEVKMDAPGPHGLALIHFILHTDDGESPELLIAGTAANIRQIPVDLVEERGAAIRDARERRAVDELAKLEILSRGELESARAKSRSMLARAGERAWSLSAIAGVVLGALAFGVIMPLASLPEVRRYDNAYAWEALARTYPVPWVIAWSDEAIARRRSIANTALLARLRPEHRETIGVALSWLDAHHARELPLQLVHPPMASIEAADAWLAAAIPAGASPAPIILVRAYEGAWGQGTGGPLAAALQTALAVPDDVLDVVSEDVSSERESPRVIVQTEVRPTSVLSGAGTRAYAALEFTFTTRLEIPGRAPAVLGDPIVVPATEEMEVMRSDMGDLRSSPLDPTGVSSIDMLEDSMVYVGQFERAQSQAGAQLAARLLAP